jgi:hypothetical protein
MLSETDASAIRMTIGQEIPPPPRWMLTSPADSVTPSGTGVFAPATAVDFAFVGKTFGSPGVGWSVIAQFSLAGSEEGSVSPSV